MLDLTKERFGRLVPVRYLGSINKNGRWLCRCDCGNETIVLTNNLRRGLSLSCGCGHTKHGESGADVRTREYRIWANMMDRCEWGGNKPAWELYGARGIRVCKRWHDFRNFIADMGRAPKGMTLDRFPNNEGNYEPSNCRWATPSEQNLNRRNTRKVKYCGEIIPAMTLTIRLGLSYKAIRARATRRGNNFVEAFRSVGINVEAA